MALEPDRVLTCRATKARDKHHAEHSRDITKLDIAKRAAMAK